MIDGEEDEDEDEDVAVDMLVPGSITTPRPRTSQAVDYQIGLPTQGDESDLEDDDISLQSLVIEEGLFSVERGALEREAADSSQDAEDAEPKTLSMRNVQHGSQGVAQTPYATPEMHVLGSHGDVPKVYQASQPHTLSVSNWRQNLDLRCVFAIFIGDPSTFGAGGRNQNTSRIQSQPKHVSNPVATKTRLESSGKTFNPPYLCLILLNFA